MYNNNYGYGYGNLNEANSMLQSGIGSAIWLIIALIISLVGCFVIYFLFVKNDKEESNKYLAGAKTFFRFDKMLVESILKIAYIFSALFITLGSFALISSTFLGFLFTLVVGNLIARIGYEFALIKIMIWKNTVEIRNKLK